MTTIYVGHKERHTLFFADSDGPATAGTATARAISTNPTTGLEEYVQGDFITLSTAPFDHALAHLGGGRWSFAFAPDSNLAERTLTIVGTHSLVEFPAYLHHDVLTYSTDDIHDNLAIVTPADINYDDVLDPEP